MISSARFRVMPSSLNPHSPHGWFSPAPFPSPSFPSLLSSLSRQSAEGDREGGARQARGEERGSLLVSVSPLPGTPFVGGTVDCRAPDRKEGKAPPPLLFRKRLFSGSHFPTLLFLPSANGVAAKEEGRRGIISPIAEQTARVPTCVHTLRKVNSDVVVVCVPYNARHCFDRKSSPASPFFHLSSRGGEGVSRLPVCVART